MPREKRRVLPAYERGSCLHAEGRSYLGRPENLSEDDENAKLWAEDAKRRDHGMGRGARNGSTRGRCLWRSQSLPEVI